jgi:MHS family proline/betaine transporter-like MFS transporter
VASSVIHFVVVTVVAVGPDFGSTVWANATDDISDAVFESAPAHRRGFYGSWIVAGSGLALLTGALISSLVTRSLASDALDSWGWRLPFLFGLVIGPVGLYIRRRLGDMPTFAITQLHLPLSEAFAAQSIGLACFTLLVPLFGALSDRIGRKPIFIGSLVLYLSVAYPVFFWVHASPSFGKLLIMQIVLGSLPGAFSGPFATALADQFPTRMRASGLGIVSNVTTMTFAGFAPFFVTWLIEATGSPIAPVFYVIFGAAISLVAAFFLVDHAQEARLPIAEAVTVQVRTA